MNAQSVAFVFNIMFKDWKLEELNNIKKNGKKVFSCFACGGGSSMGYKKAGFEILGINEIDRELVNIYKTNFPSTKYIFNQNIQELVKNKDYPKDLFDIDVLDGSPPCSVFSIAGDREKNWGKEKKFREGQVKQRLDDLFYCFIQLAKDIQPKVVVAENVRGMIIGKAKGYVKQIFKDFNDAGYNTQLFLLNSSTMGVPQRRERIFFIAIRKDIDKKIKLDFNEDKIYYKDIKTNEGIGKELSKMEKVNFENISYKDRDFADLNLRNRNKNIGFSSPIIWDNLIPNTLISSSSFYSGNEKRHLTSTELIRIQSFPIDYNFIKNTYSNIKYILGMSVPPIMMYKVARDVYKQILE